MDLPSEITIGLHRCEVRQMTDEERGELPHRLGDWDLGRNTGYAMLIRLGVRNGAPAAAILLHEIIHGIAWLHGHDREKVPEEVWTSTLGERLAEVLRDSPELVAWLVEQLGIATEVHAWLDGRVLSRSVLGHGQAVAPEPPAG